MTNFICDRYNLNHASGNNSYVILGRDGSGVVTQVGADVFQVQPGDRVWFAIPPCFQVLLLQMVVVLAWSKPFRKQYPFPTFPLTVICQQGSLGNTIVLPIELLKKMPSSLTFEEAASIPYTLMYVWDILVTQGELIPHKKANTRSKMLICGGLRPTEMLALQLAK